MIALILTLFCLFFMYVGWGDGTTVWVMLVVLALIWFGHMVIMDNIKAEINRDEYWAKDEKERIRDRIRYEREVRLEEDEKRRKAAERTRLMEEKKAAHVREKVTVPKIHENEEKKEHVLKCERCGQEVRIIHMTTYPSGRTYVEYQCPYCSERKLKKVG